MIFAAYIGFIIGTMAEYGGWQRGTYPEKTYLDALAMCRWRANKPKRQTPQ